MLLKGIITIVTDVNFAASQLQNSKVLYVGELNPQIQQYNFIPCSVLLPPFEALNADINGNSALYKQIYMQYLTMNKYCFDMFATILVALYNGINITLFVEGGELSHAKFLAEYLIGTFGITPCTDINHPAAYNTAYDLQNASIIYTYGDGFMPCQEYIKYIPNADINVLLQINQIPYTPVVEKILKDNKVSIQNPNIAINWVKEYLEFNKGIRKYYSVLGNMISFDK